MGERMWKVAVGAAGLAALCVWVLTLMPEPADAAAGDGGWTEHPGLVPEIPERNYPVILPTPLNDGSPRQSYAVDMIGNYIISGGDFQQVQLPNGGATITQPYLAIFDSRDRSLVCEDLDVDDEVLAIAPGPRSGTAIIAGRFNRVTGPDGVERVRNKVALIDLEQCDVDRTWIVSGLNGRVTELAVTGNRLFIAGDFTSVAGTGIGNLIEVAHDDAALNTQFDPDFGGAESRAVVGMEPSPDGTRLAIVHRATSIMGASLRGTAIFNIANPANITLTAHRMDPDTGVGGGEGRPYDRYNRIQDGTISPDFSTIVLVQGPGSAQDYVTAIPTVEQTTDETWQLFIRDTTFSAAATNDVVYIAGHFCKIDEGPGDAEVLEPNGGPNVCDGAEQNDGVFRTQMAALDLDDGTPLTWNPGNNAQVGARALTVVDRGLLIGFDGDRSNDILTGTTAFFDFGASADPRDDMTCSATVNGGFVDLSWDRVDGITNYVVRRNAGWVASPGNVTSYTDAPPAATHTYFIRTTLDGVQRDITCSPTVIVSPQTQTCSATLNNNGTISLEWDSIAGQDTYIVRRNAAFIADVGADLTFVDTPGSGTFTYVIRSRKNGVTTNTTCSPSSITVDGGGGGAGDATCSATENNGTLTLDWTDVPGEDTYVVRRNNGWIATVTQGGTSFIVTDDSPGDLYEIRYRVNGQIVDFRCVREDAPPEPSVNRALGESATQSSTGFGGVPGRAVDGNTNGVWQNGSITHTTAESQPWWQVDLGESGSISTIELWNRTDACCTARLADVVVFVSDTNMSGRSLAQLEADGAVTSYSLDGVQGQTTVIDAAGSGRYVRVQLRGSDAPLSLAEVIVNS